MPWPGCTGKVSPRLKWEINADVSWKRYFQKKPLHRQKRKWDIMNAYVHLKSGRELHGVFHISLQVHCDARGAFTEYFKSSWGSCIAPEQWAIVHSENAVVRGAHLHLRHDEYFSIVQGVAYVGLYDLRSDSPTRDCHALYRLDAKSPSALIFPPGIVHAWCFPEGPAVHLQAVSEEYESYGPDDNHGCIWNDPDLGIQWPEFAPIVSERAAGFPTLAELRKKIPFKK
jgi:dTDP-4-dehydrorhamnose 3,5-epimerase